MGQYSAKPQESAEHNDIEERVRAVTRFAFVYATTFLLAMGLGIAGAVIHKELLIAAAFVVAFVGIGTAIALAAISNRGGGRI
jgi:hypothetical protein